MGTFSTTKFVKTNLVDFSKVVERVGERLTQEGYTFTQGDGALSDYFSLSKGGIFKTVLGMKTALNVELTRLQGGVSISAKIGVFGQQAIPTVITLFVAWPVVLTQIGGMIQQSQLDDKVIGMLEEEIRSEESERFAEKKDTTAQGETNFCTACGQRVPTNARFCSFCGSALQ